MRTVNISSPEVRHNGYLGPERRKLAFVEMPALEVALPTYRPGEPRNKYRHTESVSRSDSNDPESTEPVKSCNESLAGAVFFIPNRFSSSRQGAAA
jgi:hypothetical protein